MMSRIARELGPTAQHVWLGIAVHRSADGTCWPSMVTVAELTGLSRKSVQRWVARLEQAGFIEVMRRTSERGDPDTHLYRIVS